jgi:putative addiction module component (TIGR02574 family)
LQSAWGLRPRRAAVARFGRQTKGQFEFQVPFGAVWFGLAPSGSLGVSRSKVVAELIDRIMVARHGGKEPSVAESWKAETGRRIAEIESGKVKGLTPEENAARIQRILRR